MLRYVRTEGHVTYKFYILFLIKFKILTRYNYFYLLAHVLNLMHTHHQFELNNQGARQLLINVILHLLARANSVCNIETRNAFDVRPTLALPK